MEKIVLEVDERVAKAWREAPVDKRKAIANKMNLRIGTELFEYDKGSFVKYLDELRDTMASRGLKQEILDEILKDDE